MEAALKIWCIGDSMTAGAEAVDRGYRSYRGRLQAMLASAGIAADFVGSQWSPPAAGGTDPNHDGYGGAYLGPGGSVNNLSTKMDVLLPSLGADIIIVAAGWNSAYNEPADAGAKYTGLIEQIRAAKPAAKIIVGTLSPQRGETEIMSREALPGYAAVNGAARALASSTNGVYLADLASIKFSPHDYVDVIHWSQSGADKAAARIYRAVVEAAGGPPSISQPPASLARARAESSSRHEVRLLGLGQENSWEVRASMGMGLRPLAAGQPSYWPGPQIAEWRAMLPWYWVVPGVGHSASNSGVEITGMRAHFRSAATGQWSTIQNLVPGATLNDVMHIPLIGSAPPAWVRMGTSGGPVVSAAATHSAHGWSQRFPTPWASGPDALEWVFEVDHRLALLDPSGPDDRALAVLLVESACDYYPALGTSLAELSPATYVPSVTNGRFILSRPDIRTSVSWVGPQPAPTAGFRRFGPRS